MMPRFFKVLLYIWFFVVLIFYFKNFIFPELLAWL